MSRLFLWETTRDSTVFWNRGASLRELLFCYICSGLKALPTERGKVKTVDCPLVDERPRVLKSNGRKKQEKRGGIGISEAAKSLA